MPNFVTNVHVDAKETVRVRHNTLKIDQGEDHPRRIVESVTFNIGADQVIFYCNREQFLEMVRGMNTAYLEKFPYDVVVPSALTPTKKTRKGKLGSAVAVTA